MTAPWSRGSERHIPPHCWPRPLGAPQGSSRGSPHPSSALHPSSDQASGCLALWSPMSTASPALPFAQGDQEDLGERGGAGPTGTLTCGPASLQRALSSPGPTLVPPQTLPGPCPSLHSDPRTRHCLTEGPAFFTKLPALPAHRLVGGTQPLSLQAPPFLGHLPSWPECCRWSCRSHPNTRSFALPFFLPFCRDFMARAQALAQPPLSPKTFGLRVLHESPSQPWGLARPQGAGLRTGGGGWPGPQAAAPDSGAPARGSGGGRGSCQDPAQNCLVADLALAPRPAQWGGQEAVQRPKTASC